MRLKDKVAVITGAGSGIGRGMAQRFAEEGADIVAADVNAKGAKETAALVRKAGRQAIAVTADVSRRADVQRMFAAAKERFGHYDILINNAGILTWGSILELPEEDWDRVLAVNLKSMYLCCQETARYWVKEKIRGKIVNLGSFNSERAIPRIPHYCASKGGVKLFTAS
ncbi:MAG: SDR family NAD(P)-dependent oxidoreductase, partial [Chloroflexi bacterium]|nr:SDR family NAD(P)-dependent oxidoreductase [Chloroflexota bacterium]